MTTYSLIGLILLTALAGFVIGRYSAISSASGDIKAYSLPRYTLKCLIYGLFPFYTRNHFLGFCSIHNR